MQRAADAFGRRWVGQLGAEVAAEVGREGYRGGEGSERGESSWRWAVG